MAKKIQVELSVKDTGSKTIKKFSDTGSSALKKLAGPLAAGAVIASFTAMLRSTVAYGDKLHKLNLQLGVSVTELDKLKRVGDLAGVSFDQITTSIRVMARNLNDAADGTGLAKDAIKELGLNAKVLMKMNPDKAFIQIAEALSKVENPTKRAALSMEIMGRSGSVVIQMAKNLGSEVGNMGTKWDQAKANQADFVTDQNTKLKSSLEDLTVTTLPTLVAAVTALDDAFKDLVTTYNWLFKNYKQNADFMALQSGETEKLTLQLGKLNERRAELAKSNVPRKDEQLAATDKAIDITIKKLAKLQEKFEEIKRGKAAKKEAGKAAVTSGPGAGAADTLTPSPDDMDAHIALFTEHQKALNEARAEGWIESARMAEKALMESIDRDNQEIEKERAKLEEMDQMKRDARDRQIEENAKLAEEQQKMMEQVGMGFKDYMVDPMIDVIAGSKSMKDAMKESLVAILKMLAQVAIMRAIAGMGGGGGVSMPYIPAMAEGGILRGGIKAFAAGGIANKPTLGMIGEGGQNEAVVPLPNGRSIPVEMQGSSNNNGPTENTFIISAVDAKSFVDLARRNPEAIIRPLTEQIERGNKGLRANLKKAVS